MYTYKLIESDNHPMLAEYDISLGGNDNYVAKNGPAILKFEESEFLSWMPAHQCNPSSPTYETAGDYSDWHNAIISQQIKLGI